MVNTAVTLCGLPLENPVIPASGTFGYGYEFAQIYDINCLGTFSFKGTTLTPRYGNPTPRIAEYAGGLLNSVGLQNPGVEAVIREELPRLREVFHKPVMANISGFSIEEYAQVCRQLDGEEQVGWLEVNISCPNVHGGGIRHIGPEQGKALFFRDAAQPSFLMAAHGDQQGHLRPELHNLFSGEFRGKGIHAQFH